MRVQRTRWTLVAGFLLLTWAAMAQAPPAVNLESVLDSMDRAAATFKSAEADFVWDQYQKVVDETDSQSGKVHFRRNSKEIQMAADIQKPEAKIVLFADGQVKLYQPKIDQVTVYNAGKNRQEMESFLVLGFGGRGQDLPLSYDVRFAGVEPIDGVTTGKLELTPKSQRTRSVFSRIVLWIDLVRGVSLRQQLFEPTGDYRLAKYTNIQMNQKIPDDVFKLKTTSKTKTVTPQG